MTEMSGLTIRQHERHSIELRVEFVVAESYTRQVRFSPNAATPGQAVVPGRSEDISPGGMGVTLELFVPRMCEGTVRVFSPVPVEYGPDGTPRFEAIFEHAVKVRRVYMNSHQPTYWVGVAFIDPQPDLGVRIQEVLLAAGADATRPTAGERTHA